MKLLFCLIMIVPYFGVTQVAQTGSIALRQELVPGAKFSTSGIQWTEGLSWEQIKEKAKKESKFIFIDCFTTWCGPCKMMDKDIYVNDTVGDYFNQRFIAVKVQMDKTKNDNEQVQRWYQDALTIGNEYRIEAYPTFVFLSPSGVMVHKGTCYKMINDFLSLAEEAIKPGKVYEDSYGEYDRLVADYKKGIKHYDRMLYMIKVALKFDTSLARLLTKCYIDNLYTLKASERYTKENIEFWSLFILSSKSRIFQFFYQGENKVDKVMKQKGYAARIIDQTVNEEVVIPFFKEQNKNPSIPMTGMYLGGRGVKADYSEADWTKLRKMIQQQFNSTIAKRNVLSARIEWYKRHWNSQGVNRYTLLKLEKIQPDLQKEFVNINQQAWDAFLHVTDKKILSGYIKWMKKVVEYKPKYDVLIDTYANLLYKVGRKKEAIHFEEKAMNAANGEMADTYRKVLEQMKSGLSTYGVLPVM